MLIKDINWIKNRRQKISLTKSVSLYLLTNSVSLSMTTDDDLVNRNTHLGVSIFLIPCSSIYFAKNAFVEAGEFESLPAGGYVAVIKNVEDDPQKECLKISFDIS